MDRVLRFTSEAILAFLLREFQRDATQAWSYPCWKCHLRVIPDSDARIALLLGETLKADRFLKSYFQLALWRPSCVESEYLAYYKLAALSGINTLLTI